MKKMFQRECPDCYGLGDIEVQCDCPECGDAHTTTRDCDTCHCTGKIDVDDDEDAE